MLKRRLQDFYDLVDRARVTCGDSAPRITDAVLREAFPQAIVGAEADGCEKMLRTGVRDAVAFYLRKLPADERQRSFADIDPELLPMVTALRSQSYFVPGPGDSYDEGGEYVPVAELIDDLPQLNAARLYLRQKGQETLDEADRLDVIYNELVARECGLA